MNSVEEEVERGLKSKCKCLLLPLRLDLKRTERTVSLAIIALKLTSNRLPRPQGRVCSWDQVRVYDDAVYWVGWCEIRTSFNLRPSSGKLDLGCAVLLHM